MIAPVVRHADLGCTPYADAWALQRALVEERKAGLGSDWLLTLEHEPVITLGRRADPAHVLLDRDALAVRGIELFEVERGGDVTYHGPGQLVAYPILDLHGHRRDVRWYSGALLESVVRTASACGVPATARVGRDTGVWVLLAGGGEAKIGALGVRIERWVTYHGVALNVDPDLSHFEAIVPCGLAGVRTSSLASILGRSPAMGDVRDAFVRAFADVLGVRVEPADAPWDRLAARDR